MPSVVYRFRALFFCDLLSLILKSKRAVLNVQVHISPVSSRIHTLVAYHSTKRTFP